MNEENKKSTNNNAAQNVQGAENIFKKKWMHSLISVVVIFGSLVGFLFWQTEKNTIFIENSDLEAPIINLSPTASGVLNAIYVKEGGVMQPNSQIALVGSQIISAKEGGIVSYAPIVLGAYFSPGQVIASIVNIKEMKVVGQIEETKGLKDIMKGQRATFTVDAFPGHTYEGIVDEVSPTSSETGIVFSISDKRPIKKFNVKVVFDVDTYKELKNGMSAKITVHTK
jgi:multidrug resistance efflux pump